MKELDYKVIATGSAGNAIRIEDIMIDCGVPYKNMKDELYKCKALFITHTHSDHLRMQTFKMIKRHHRRLKIIGNWQVAQKVGVDIISNIKPIESKNWTLTPFEVPHNVLTQGFELKTKSGFDVVFATDSAGNKTWPKGEYDYLFIESNHDENLINQVNRKDYGYDVFQNAKRHTSKQESKAYYYLHRKSKDSKWIELHQSSRFYR